MSNEYLKVATSSQIPSPEYSEWVCEVGKGIYYRPYKGREPNWWNRLMHRVWLGFIWKRDTQ